MLNVLHRWLLEPEETIVVGHYHVRQCCSSCEWNPSARQKETDICHACGEHTVATVGRHVTTTRTENVFSFTRQSTVFERKRRL